MIETLFAGLALLACLLLALRLAIGERRRWRLDAWLRHRVAGTGRWLGAALRWRSARKSSAKAAEEAIRRARGGSWDGNVYRPRSFRRPRKPH